MDVTNQPALNLMNLQNQIILPSSEETVSSGSSTEAGRTKLQMTKIVFKRNAITNNDLAD